MDDLKTEFGGSDRPGREFTGSADERIQQIEESIERIWDRLNSGRRRRGRRLRLRSVTRIVPKRRRSAGCGICSFLAGVAIGVVTGALLSGDDD